MGHSGVGGEVGSPCQAVRTTCTEVQHGLRAGKHKLHFICRKARRSCGRESEEGVLDRKGSALCSSSPLSTGSYLPRPLVMPKPWIIPKIYSFFPTHMHLFTWRKHFMAHQNYQHHSSLGRLLSKIRMAWPIVLWSCSHELITETGKQHMHPWDPGKRDDWCPGQDKAR